MSISNLEYRHAVMFSVMNHYSIQVALFINFFLNAFLKMTFIRLLLYGSVYLQGH